jgi:hypothetical protein
VYSTQGVLNAQVSVPAVTTVEQSSLLKFSVIYGDGKGAAPMPRQASSRPRRVPAYSLHRASGKAVVRLDGKDHYLGDFGTPESHSRYAKLIAEWQRLGQMRSSQDLQGHRPQPKQLSISELILRYCLQRFAHFAERWRWESFTNGAIFSSLAERRLRRGFSLALHARVALDISGQHLADHLGVDFSQRGRALLQLMLEYLLEVPTRACCEWVWDEIDHANQDFQDYAELVWARKEAADNVCGLLREKVQQLFELVGESQKATELGALIGQLRYPTPVTEHLQEPVLTAASGQEATSAPDQTGSPSSLMATPHLGGFSQCWTEPIDPTPLSPPWPFWEINRPRFEQLRSTLRRHFQSLGCEFPQASGRRTEGSTVRQLLSAASRHKTSMPMSGPVNPKRRQKSHGKWRVT